MTVVHADELSGRRVSRSAWPTIIVPSEVVAPLRAGLLIELGAAADQLSRLIDRGRGRIDDIAAHEQTCRRINATQALLERVGVAAPLQEVAVALELSDYPLIAYRALEAHLIRLTQAVEDAEAEGLRRPMPDPALDEFLTHFRQELERLASTDLEAPAPAPSTPGSRLRVSRQRRP